MMKGNDSSEYVLLSYNRFEVRTKKNLVDFENQISERVHMFYFSAIQ